MDEEVKWKPVRRFFPTLFRWWAALTFDSESTYEAHRGKTNSTRTAITLAIIIILLPLLAWFVNGVVNDDYNNYWEQIEILDIESSGSSAQIEGFLDTLWTGIVIALQTVTALYAASIASAYVGQKQFKSKVTAKEHFGLSGLYLVPTFLLGFAIVAIFLILNWFKEEANWDSDIFELTETVTYNAFALLAVGLFTFSNCVIHKVNSWRAILISTVSLTIFVLTFAWLWPIAISFI